MDISKLLQENQILCKVKAPASKEQLLEMMAETLVKGNVVTMQQDFLDAVIRRENEMTTQTQGGIALPHACHSSVNKLGLAIATVDGEGIVFADGTDCNCKLLFMIAIPEATPAAHIPLYSFLADFILNSGALDKLMAADSPSEVIEFLKKWQESTTQKQ